MIMEDFQHRGNCELVGCHSKFPGFHKLCRISEVVALGALRNKRLLVMSKSYQTF